MNKQIVDNLMMSVQSAVCDGVVKWSDDPAVIAVAEKHDIAHLVSQAKSMEAVYRDTLQTKARSEIAKALGNAGIEFLFLKGSVIRDLYPETWMRTAADIDFLVRKESLADAEAVLKSIGYKWEFRGDHHSNFTTSDGVTIEAHFTLIAEGVLTCAEKALSEVWNYVNDGELNPVMFYYYHIAHMAAHFQSGGACGIRSFIDLWLMRNRTDWNIEACSEFTRENGLEVFEQTCVALSEHWLGVDEVTFDDERSDELITSNNFGVDYNTELEEWIVDGYIYGTVKQSSGARMAREGSKLRLVMKRAFLPYNRLRQEYPALDGKPVLIPIFWVRRIIRHTRKFGVSRITPELHQIADLNSAEVERIAQLYKQIGL